VAKRNISWDAARQVSVEFRRQMRIADPLASILGENTCIHEDIEGETRRVEWHQLLYRQSSNRVTRNIFLKNNVYQENIRTSANIFSTAEIWSSSTAACS
jgi:hypothetical protein